MLLLPDRIKNALPPSRAGENALKTSARARVREVTQLCFGNSEEPEQIIHKKMSRGAAAVHSAHGRHGDDDDDNGQGAPLGAARPDGDRPGHWGAQEAE